MEELGESTRCVSNTVAPTLVPTHVCLPVKLSLAEVAFVLALFLVPTEVVLHVAAGSKPRITLWALERFDV